MFGNILDISFVRSVGALSAAIFVAALSQAAWAEPQAAEAAEAAMPAPAVVTPVAATPVEAPPAEAPPLAEAPKPVPPPVIQTVADALRAWVTEQLPLPAGAGRFSSRGHWLAVYEARGFAPLWLDGEVQSPRATELVDYLVHLRGERPDLADHHLQRLQPRLREAQRTLQQSAELELWLTDALLTVGAALFHGRVEPAQADPEWRIERPRFDPTAVVTALFGRGERVDGVMAGLEPGHPGFLALRKALDTYRNFAKAGKWPTVPQGGKLELGVSDPRVKALRRRLEAEGDLARKDGGGQELFDEAVKKAVSSFQARHGLTVDGVVGAGTIRRLNVPADAWARSIELNLERWRWLPRTFGERFILVNIPGFELHLYTEGEHKPALRMKTIVGRKDRETPSFTAAVSYLVLNPTWHVPPKLIREDILPHLVADHTYLEARGIRPVGVDGARVPISNEELVRLASNARSFPYQLVQESGPRNALGRIKFMLPNPYDIYLHDTPDQGLFGRDTRAFSSGCIRLERPLDLAEALVRGDRKWGEEGRLRSVINSGERKVVNLQQSVPAYLLYMTAWVDAQGRIRFGKDIYGRDKALGEMLLGKVELP